MNILFHIGGHIPATACSPPYSETEARQGFKGRLRAEVCATLCFNIPRKMAAREDINT